MVSSAVKKNKKDADICYYSDRCTVLCGIAANVLAQLSYAILAPVAWDLTYCMVRYCNDVRVAVNNRNDCYSKADCFVLDTRFRAYDDILK